MRTRLFIAFIACVLTGGADPARAQEAGRIVEQYVKAAGGGRALAKIQPVTLEGAFTSVDGKSGTYTLDTKLPNRYYSELLVGETNLIEAYNGKSAWHRNAAGELGTLVGPEGMQLEAAAQYYNSRLLNLKKSKVTLAPVGHAEVRGKDALEVEVNTPTGVKRQAFFDPETHLIVKEAATVGGVEEAFLYDDYRTVDGVKLPNKIELHRGNDKYDISVTRAVINGTVGERVFDFPIKSLLTPVSLCSIVSYMRMLILSIRLRAEQLQGLEKFAKERHLSVGWCIRAAVDEWLKKNAKN